MSHSSCQASDPSNSAGSSLRRVRNVSSCWCSWSVYTIFHWLEEHSRMNTLLWFRLISITERYLGRLMDRLLDRMLISCRKCLTSCCQTLHKQELFHWKLIWPWFQRKSWYMLHSSSEILLIICFNTSKQCIFCASVGASITAWYSDTTDSSHHAANCNVHQIRRVALHG